MEDWTDSRITVSRTASAVVVTIPARRQWIAIIFIAVWLCAWTVGGLTTLATLFVGEGGAGPKAFIIFWLCAWALGWAMAFSTVFWMLFGREVITLDAGRLTREFIALRRFRSRSYATTAIRDLTVIANDGATGAYQGRRNVMGRPGLAFDFGARTIEIGLGLDRAEARVVSEALAAGLPNQARA